MARADYPVVKVVGWEAEEPFPTRLTLTPAKNEGVNIGHGYSYSTEAWDRDELVEAIAVAMDNRVQNPVIRALSFPSPAKIIKARNRVPTITSRAESRWSSSRKARIEIYYSIFCFGLVIKSKGLRMRMPLRRFLKALNQVERLRGQSNL